MILISACVLALAAQTPVTRGVEPVVIPALLNPGRCRISITIAGQPELFLIDTGIEKSYIRSDVKAKVLRADPKAVLTFGAGTIPVSSLPSQSSTVYQEFPPISGIVGMDVLSKVVFSIDFDKHQVMVWSDAVTGNDLGSGFFKPNEEIASIPLLLETGYLAPFVQTSLGEAVIDTGAAVSLLSKNATRSEDVLSTSLSRPMEFFETTAGRATRVVVKELLVGGREIFCQSMLLSDTTDVGVISATLLGRKVLFDIPHKRVEYAVPSDNDRACATFGALLHGTVEEKNGELFLRAQTAKNLGATKSPLVRILSIDGRKSTDWLEMFRNRDPRTPDELRKAFDSLSKKGRVMVEHNGKPEPLLLAPFLSP
jgi:hypothetical protein